MPCPYCNNDLSQLENYDNINQYHECDSCKNQVYLDYDEWCWEDDEGMVDCSDLWDWLKKEKHE